MWQNAGRRCVGQGAGKGIAQWRTALSSAGLCCAVQDCNSTAANSMERLSSPSEVSQVQVSLRVCRNKKISLGVNYRDIGIRRIDIHIEEKQQTWCLAPTLLPIPAWVLLNLTNLCIFL